MCFPVLSTSSAIQTTNVQTSNGPQTTQMLVTETTPTETPSTATTETTTSQTTASTIQITSPGKFWTWSEKIHETGVMIILTTQFNL